MSLEQLIKNRNIEGLKTFMADHNLILKGNKIVPRDEETIRNLRKTADFWNQRQQAR